MSKNNKIIKDIVYGYVDLDEDMMKIIDTPHFQRLRRIKQLTSSSVYPNANHSRFEHSLGVLKIANEFMNNLENQLKKRLSENKVSEEHANKEITYLKNHMKYAALLHDIGHAPFSHLGEEFYSHKDISKNMQKLIQKMKVQLDYNYMDEKIGAKHERMSCILILDKYYNILNKIYPEIDYSFLFRIIIGNRYNQVKKWPENIIISIVNSNSIDADKLDYLLRDNYMVGNVGTYIDFRRLMRSLVIDDNNQITFAVNGISAVQDVIDCRDSLYLYVYNHHTSVYIDFLTYTLIEHCSKIGKISEQYAKKNKKRKYLYKFNKESLYINKLFTTKAQLNGIIDDSLIINHFNKIFSLKKKSRYSKSILEQLYEMRHLKASWKSIFEFEEYLNSLGDTLKKKMLKIISQSDLNRRKIVKKLQEKLDLEPGEVFIIARENKMYFMKDDNEFPIFFSKENKDRMIDKLLPQKDAKKITKIAFYIYAKNEEVIKKILEELPKIIREDNFNTKIKGKVDSKKIGSV